MKKVKTALEEKAKAEGASDEDKERPEKFVAAAQNYAKKIVANFKDWEFYTGESMDPDGMVVLLNYREDGTTPYLVYFKDGLKIEKVVCILLSQLLMLSKNVFPPLSPLLSCLLDKVMYAHTNSSCNAILHSSTFSSPDRPPASNTAFLGCKYISASKVETRSSWRFHS